MTVVLFAYGYGSFRPWNIQSFFLNYTMLPFNVVLYVGCKVVNRTKWIRPTETDLKWEADITAAYEAVETEPINTFWEGDAATVHFQQIWWGEEGDA